METMLFTCLLALFVTRGLSSTLSTFTDSTASAITCSGSDVVFEEQARSVIRCASKCSRDKCCDGYFYTDASGTCVGCKPQPTSGDALEEGTVYFRKGGVPWEYFEGSHYTINHIKQPYTEAKAYCQGLCSYPVHVNSQAEVDYLKTVVLTGPAFMGLEQSEATNEWFWGDDGSEVIFSYWNESQPDSNGYQRCAVISYDYNWTWFDVSCHSFREVVCERK